MVCLDVNPGVSISTASSNHLSPAAVAAAAAAVAAAAMIGVATVTNMEDDKEKELAFARDGNLWLSKQYLEQVMKGEEANSV